MADRRAAVVVPGVRHARRRDAGLSVRSARRCELAQRHLGAAEHHRVSCRRKHVERLFRSSPPRRRERHLRRAHADERHVRAERDFASLRRASGRGDRRRRRIVAAHGRAAALHRARRPGLFRFVSVFEIPRLRRLRDIHCLCAASHRGNGLRGDASARLECALPGRSGGADHRGHSALQQHAGHAHRPARASAPSR